MKRTAEVVIVGGGCMGASVAYHLTRRGVTDVVLVEREAMLATGSTGRNADGVRHQFSNDTNIRLSIESISVLERFADEVGAAIDFHQDGYLFLLSTEASVETFRRNVALQRSLGVDVDRLDAKAAASLAPGLQTEGVIGATFCRRDGIADPNGVTMGFAKAAQAAGAAIERDTEVTGIRASGGHVTAVETSKGTTETRTVERDDRDADGRQRRRPARARDRASRRRGRPGRSVSPAHFYCPGAGVGRGVLAGAGEQNHGDRLRDDVLLSSRGRRSALRHGWPE